MLKKSQACQKFFQFSFFSESLNFIPIVIYSLLYFQTKSHNEPWNFFPFFPFVSILIFSPCKSYHLYESYLLECLWQYLEEFFFSFSNNNHYHYSLLNSSKVLISFNLSQILSQFLPLFYIWTISFLSLFFPPVITLFPFFSPSHLSFLNSHFCFRIIIFHFWLSPFLEIFSVLLFKFYFIFKKFLLFNSFSYIKLYLSLKKIK